MSLKQRQEDAIRFDKELEEGTVTITFEREEANELKHYIAHIVLPVSDHSEIWERIYDRLIKEGV